ncbi:MAG: efflux RND transporter periplasmic adaptor subunit [Planctomycetota bacterium]|jgi:HlyD family secretion protein
MKADKENQKLKMPNIGAPPAGQALTNRRRMWMALILLAAVVIVPTVLLAMKAAGSGSSGDELSTFTVRRDNLTVKVTESGSIKARNTIEIKSQRERSATILSIVPEGTYITQEDVDNGKVLVELDAAALQEELTQREIDLASAEASYTQAKEAHQIQIKQNESDKAAAELTVKFAMIDLRKYLGDTVAKKFVATMEDTVNTSEDIAALIEDPQLGGDALQRLRALTEDISLKEQTFKLAKVKADWSRKLLEKKYISQTEMEADNLDRDRKEISWRQAQTATDLFKRYEFPKQAEQYLSNYKESKRALDRTYASARSRLAQAQANLKSTESRLHSRQDRLNKTTKQIEVSTIKAPDTGLVTYGSSGDGFGRRWRQGPIEEGGSVREHQTIISLPDMSKMTASIAVHESSVDKVRAGQKATIVMDAFPDKTFSGEVTKVAPLPDQQQSWLSPDLKVYKTEVDIEGTYDFLRPGMSAKVEILVEKLNDVLIVPVQVVANRNGKKVCYVVASKPKEREVETGSFSDTFVQIIEGLEPGEKVLLSPPKITETDKADPEAEAKAGQEKHIKSKAQPQPESKLQADKKQEQGRRGESGATDKKVMQEQTGKGRPGGRGGRGPRGGRGQ